MTIEADETAHAAQEGRGDVGGRRAVALARLGIGLAQGIALYLLMRTTQGEGATWSRLNPELFAPAILVALFLPAVLLSGVGRLRLGVYVVWSVVAAAALALLAWHDVARQAGDAREATFPLFAFGAAALFIAHHLIVPADRERRLIASFPAYFDTAWMAGVQLVLSIAFAGAFWLLLFLGAALFNIIGLSFLGDLINKGWFSLPLTGMAFATAVHLTDVRDGLIRGVRTVALMLLSWLLLVLTVLVATFLAALPFTGLDGLWETGSATALVLAAAGVLIVLINAAYQDGQPDSRPPAVLRVAGRAAALLLTPLILIAAWGLYLRIGQHGLTPDRIIAMACAGIGAVYAGGYGYAALRTFWTRGDWMRPLERTNVVTAVVQVVVILALFTPLADPARLSVADQVSRLSRGAVAVDQFDFGFLRFESGKAGQRALAELARSTDAAVAARARAIRAASDRADLQALESGRTTLNRTPVIEVIGPALPNDFLGPVGRSDLRYDCDDANPCVASVRDLDKDGQVEVVLALGTSLLLFAEERGVWVVAGEWTQPFCPTLGFEDPREALRKGRLVQSEPRWPDLSLGSSASGRFRFGDACPRDPSQDNPGPPLTRRIPSPQTPSSSPPA